LLHYFLDIIIVVAVGLDDSAGYRNLILHTHFLLILHLHDAVLSHGHSPLHDALRTLLEHAIHLHAVHLGINLLDDDHTTHLRLNVDQYSFFF